MGRRWAHIFLAGVAIGCSLAGCTRRAASSSGMERLPFSADSAYQYVARQMTFGARVPGTAAHHACCDWLIATLTGWGISVCEQQGEMPDYAGDAQTVRNIIARIDGTDPQALPVLLCAHWDCRPWSDEEDDYNDRFLPVPGANDGASGVGVLLEIARQLQVMRGGGQAFPAVDMVFFDCEDMGTPRHYTGTEREDTWCLGSQLWAERYRQTPPDKRARYGYGVLLDMVGDPSATFHKEYFSMSYARPYAERLWRTASDLGYARYFVDKTSYPVTDDHYYINTLAGIPCVDIIDYKMQNGTGFPDWWHTQQDDMRNIHKQTLQAVGETVLTTLCLR